ncbi:MAG: outer membrane beta-barrel protein [Bdellovibrionales bacterium]|nr:outer membrane beta-barrel protein [Bdellovibrionales bacterium]
MKKSIFAIAFALVASSAMADEGMMSTDSKYRLGVDFGIPYFLTADGNKVNDRGNMNLGVDGRYFVTENMNVGGRFSYDLEDSNGFRQIAVAPGVQYHWMPGETFVPYVRGDLPVIIQGAANSVAQDDKFDFGISAGAGVAWNLGNTIGVENLSIRYDFNLGYTFGISDAVPVLGLEFAKVGVDYRF